MTQFFRTWDSSASFVSWLPNNFNVGSRHPKMFVKPYSNPIPNQSSVQADRVSTNTWQICLRHLVALGSAYPHQKSQLLKLKVKIPGDFVGIFWHQNKIQQICGYESIIGSVCVVYHLWIVPDGWDLSMNQTSDRVMRARLFNRLHCPATGEHIHCMT